LTDESTYLIEKPLYKREKRRRRKRLEVDKEIKIRTEKEKIPRKIPNPNSTKIFISQHFTNTGLL